MSAWDLPADDSGAELLDDVEAFLSRFVVYPGDTERVAHVLWIAHCWFMDAWDSTPRIAFLSPEPGSGKSRALEVTEPLVPRAVHAVNATPSALFRKVSDEAGAPTILFDEIDTIFGPKAKDNEDLRGLINAGHRRGATTLRSVVRGKGQIEVEEFPSYCAVALAGLDDLPDTIMTRSVVVRMRRRAPGEKVEPWRRRVNGPDAEDLQLRLVEWSNLHQHTINTWPEMPEGVEDRNADVWEALLAVADLAGGEWPKRGRVAAVTAVTDARQAKASMGVMLLRDIRDIFARLGVDRMATTDLLIELNNLDESPWGDIRGRELDPRSLSRRLLKYGIKPATIRIGDNTAKGYLSYDSRDNVETLADAWERYLPPSTPPDVAVTAVTTETESPSPRPDWAAGMGAFSDLASKPGRCGECAFHIESQGHRDGCSDAVAS